MIHPSAKIHPTALVADGAVIGEDVVIGPFCIIEGSVEIKARTVLNSHIVVKGDTVIGEDNQIYQFASIGEVNQDLKYKGEATKTIIGNGNLIREHVTIHRGTIQGGGVTRIGNNNLLMIGAHVMLGGGSMVSQDVPPYVMAQGNHAQPFGVNLEGLKRRGFDKPTMHAIRNVYKMIYRSGKTLEEVLPEIEQIAQTESAISFFVEFFKRSTRGIIR